jgi:hypothetical protein
MKIEYAYAGVMLTAFLAVTGVVYVRTEDDAQREHELRADCIEMCNGREEARLTRVGDDVLECRCGASYGYAEDVE